jgi:hypothetical protein
VGASPRGGDDMVVEPGVVREVQGSGRGAAAVPSGGLASAVVAAPHDQG